MTYTIALSPYQVLDDIPLEYVKAQLTTLLQKFCHRVLTEITLQRIFVENSTLKADIGGHGASQLMCASQGPYEVCAPFGRIKIKCDVLPTLFVTLPEDYFLQPVKVVSEGLSYCLLARQFNYDEYLFAQVFKGRSVSWDLIYGPLQLITSFDEVLTLALEHSLTTAVATYTINPNTSRVEIDINDYEP